MRISRPDILPTAARTFTIPISELHNLCDENAEKCIRPFDWLAQNPANLLRLIREAAQALTSETTSDSQLLESFLHAYANMNLKRGKMQLVPGNYLIYFTGKPSSAMPISPTTKSRFIRGKTVGTVSNDPPLNPTPVSWMSSGFRPVSLRRRCITCKVNGSMNDKPHSANASKQPSVSWSVGHQLGLSPSCLTSAGIASVSSRGTPMDWDPAISSCQEIAMT